MDELTLFSQSMIALADGLGQPKEIFISPHRSPSLGAWGLKDGEFVMKVGRTLVYADSSLSQKEVRYRCGIKNELQITVEM